MLVRPSTIPLLLAIPLAGRPVLAAAQAPVTVAAPQAPAAADPLDEEFAALHARLTKSRAGLHAAGREAVADAAYRSAFEALAERGSDRAAAWLLATFAANVDAPREVLAERAALYERLARQDADRLWLLDPELDVLGALRRDAQALGRGPAIRLAEEFARVSTDDEIRAAALGSAAQLEARWTDGDPARRERARVLHAEIVRRFPKTAQAQASVDALWQLANLEVGAPAPEILARDVDGNEIRLSDLRHRVVLVEFWTATAPDVQSWAARRRALHERHLDDRFAILGINLDRDELRFRHVLTDLDIEWMNAFEPGVERQDVWRVHSGGANVLVDAQGVVRGIDLRGPALEQAIASLLPSQGGVVPQASTTKVGAAPGR